MDLRYAWGATAAVVLKPSQGRCNLQTRWKFRRSMGQFSTIPRSHCGFSPSPGELIHNDSIYENSQRASRWKPVPRTWTSVARFSFRHPPCSCARFGLTASLQAALTGHATPLWLHLGREVEGPGKAGIRATALAKLAGLLDGSSESEASNSSNRSLSMACPSRNRIQQFHYVKTTLHHIYWSSRVLPALHVTTPTYSP